MLRRAVWLGVLLGGALGCSSPEMRVSFPGFPDSVQGLAADDCKLTSRSPRKHLLRVGLSVLEDGREVGSDSVVKVRIHNFERGNVLANVDLKANGEVVEVTLDGPANTGEHLVLMGTYAVGGTRHDFEQKCHVD